MRGGKIEVVVVVGCFGQVFGGDERWVVAEECA